MKYDYSKTNKILWDVETDLFHEIAYSLHLRNIINAVATAKSKGVQLFVLLEKMADN